MRNRTYDPALGRFLQRDPIRLAGGLNMYAFCGGDPINRVDPTGLDMEEYLELLRAGGTVVGAGVFTIGAAATAPVSAPVVVFSVSGAALAGGAATPEGAAGFGSLVYSHFAKAEDVLVKRPPSAPVKAYDRVEDYGRTPTKADRRALKAGPDDRVDHVPPLVQRYYEGDPSLGEKPGYLMNQVERRASANDRKRMQLQPKDESNSQGGEMRAYSLKKRKEFGL